MRHYLSGRIVSRAFSIAFAVIAAAIALFVPGSLLNPTSSGIPAHSLVVTRLSAPGVCNLMAKTGITAFLGKAAVDPAYGAPLGCTIEAPDGSAIVLQLYPGTAAATSSMYNADNLESHRNTMPGDGKITNPAIAGTGGASVFYAPSSWYPTTVIAEWVASGFGYDGQIQVDYTTAHQPAPIAQIIQAINSVLVQTPANPINRPAPVTGGWPRPSVSNPSLRQWNGKKRGDPPV